ncbi:MAG: hypothetical protein J7518_19045 [Nocardioidaceae bacterium]|nr:hypothetical protein [Nocardioidaceae bacterium]
MRGASVEQVVYCLDRLLLVFLARLFPSRFAHLPGMLAQARPRVHTEAALRPGKRDASDETSRNELGEVLDKALSGLWGVTAVFIAGATLAVDHWVRLSSSSVLAGFAVGLAGTALSLSMEHGVVRPLLRSLGVRAPLVALALRLCTAIATYAGLAFAMLS